jgi:hypothetical protein
MDLIPTIRLMVRQPGSVSRSVRPATKLPAQDPDFTPKRRSKRPRCSGEIKDFEVFSDWWRLLLRLWLRLLMRLLGTCFASAF